VIIAPNAASKPVCTNGSAAICVRVNSLIAHASFDRL
jgi:hypothetical protein